MLKFKLLFLSVVSLAIAMAAFPVSASDISGYEIVTQESALDTRAEKQLIIECPAGKYALGAGWAAVEKTGAFIEGHAMASSPAWDGSSWTFNIRNVSYPFAWKIRARIICAKVTSH